MAGGEQVIRAPAQLGMLLRAYGLPMASTEMARFDGERCLIVQRFDRRLHSSGTYWLRLPSEDCCQATSTPAANKYENNGGPGMAAIDGHAKNFSLFLHPRACFRLTPLYNLF